MSVGAVGFRLCRVTLERELACEGVQIARNLAVRWDEANPRIGVDPDVCVLSPPPPEGTERAASRSSGV